MSCARSSAGSAVSQVRSGEVQQTASVVAEKGKEYGAQGWSMLRGVVAKVATQVESVASEHGYKVDLGACFFRPSRLFLFGPVDFCVKSSSQAAASGRINSQLMSNLASAATNQELAS